jgi:hypothetical protein
LDVDGAAVVLDADAVAGLVAVAEPDVLGLVVAVVAVLGVESAGDCGLLKSVHDSVRTVSPSALTLNVLAVTV